MLIIGQQAWLACGGCQSVASTMASTLSACDTKIRRKGRVLADLDLERAAPGWAPHHIMAISGSSCTKGSDTHLLTRLEPNTLKY